jgi:hypothetical protein
MQKIQDLFMNFLFIMKKLGVWCAIHAYRIIGPIFYDDTDNAARCMRDIPHQIIQPEDNCPPHHFRFQ